LNPGTTEYEYEAGVFTTTFGCSLIVKTLNKHSVNVRYKFNNNNNVRSSIRNIGCLQINLGYVKCEVRVGVTE
jgi:hypothetical protein